MFVSAVKLNQVEINPSLFISSTEQNACDPCPFPDLLDSVPADPVSVNLFMLFENVIS